MEVRIKHEVGELRTAVNDRLALHESKFEDFTTVVKERLDLHESKLEGFKTVVNERFELHETKLDNVATAIKERSMLHETMLDSLETTAQRQYQALSAQMENLAVSFKSMHETQNRLERRMETQPDRLITIHTRMTWAIIGSAAVAGICLAAGWLLKMLSA